MYMMYYFNFAARMHWIYTIRYVPRVQYNLRCNESIWLIPGTEEL